MSTNSTDEGLLTGRRLFLRQVATLAGSASLAPKVIGAAAVAAGSAIAAPASAQPAGAPIASAPAFGYESLGPDEASFVEAMVNVMCPADNLTPGGVDCGLAVFIDRQLAGGFGKGERLYMRGPWKKGKPQLGYQLPLTPEQFFKEGVAAADAACVKRSGKTFYQLEPAQQDAYLS